MSVIVRMCEVQVVASAAADFADWLADRAVRALLAGPGVLGVEVLRGVDQPDRFVVLSRWSDAAALAAFTAGGSPAPELPVGHESRLAGPAHVWHFDVVNGAQPTGGRP